MTPDPQKCLSESKRVLKEGGVLACSSWQGSQWMDLMNSLKKVRPDKQMLEVPKEWMEVELMKGELEKAGFKDVESLQVETKMRFEKLETFCDFVILKVPHIVALTKDMSEEEIAKFKTTMMEEGRKMCPNEPGELKGVALIAVGRK